MPKSFIRAIQRLELEEKILNMGSTVALLGVFMPWFGGEWFSEPTVWSGFGFYTSFVGLLIFLAHTFILSITLLPLMGYQVIKPSLRDSLRLITSLECVLLTIVVWSVLTNITFDRSHMEIRFGLYLTLIGSIITALYAFLRIQQQQKLKAQEFFHHPEEDTIHTPHEEHLATTTPLPPPPPAPPPPEHIEEPRLFQ